jgi:hypothetical protein
MARRVMQELSDMMKVDKRQEEIDDRLVQKAIRERQVRDYFNNQIHAYLRSKRK